MMNAASLLVVSAVAVLWAAPQARPIVGSTDAPRLIDTGGTGSTIAMTASQYADFAAKIGGPDSIVVPIVKKPASLSPRAMYGINLILRGHNLGWILDGDAADGYVLFADWNGNGDVTDETPMRFDRSADGTYSMRVNREERDGDVTYPVSMKLVIDHVAPPGKTEKQLALNIYGRTTRSGVIALPDARPLTFRLSGASGMYAAGSNRVSFDLNGDGSFDPDTEVFRVSEKRVNIGDTSYEFAVDPYGRSLTLTPLAEHVATRAALTIGSAAPDFSFVDTAGKARKLSDYRGKVVLLDFWGTWCVPCRVEAPKLVTLYNTFHDRGLEILGLDTLDTPAQVEEFVSKYKMRWAQTIEPDRGPIQTLYRINGWPSYLLIDRDGTIRLVGGSSTDLDHEVAALIR